MKSISDNDYDEALAATLGHLKAQGRIANKDVRSLTELRYDQVIRFSSIEPSMKATLSAGVGSARSITFSPRMSAIEYGQIQRFLQSISADQITLDRFPAHRSNFF